MMINLDYSTGYMTSDGEIIYPNNKKNLASQDANRIAEEHREKKIDSKNSKTTTTLQVPQNPDNRVSLGPDGTINPVTERPSIVESFSVEDPAQARERSYKTEMQHIAENIFVILQKRKKFIRNVIIFLVIFILAMVELGIYLGVIQPWKSNNSDDTNGITAEQYAAAQNGQNQLNNMQTYLNSKTYTTTMDAYLQANGASIQSISSSTSSTNQQITVLNFNNETLSQFQLNDGYAYGDMNTVFDSWNVVGHKGFQLIIQKNPPPDCKQNSDCNSIDKLATCNIPTQTCICDPSGAYTGSQCQFPPSPIDSRFTSACPTNVGPMCFTSVPNLANPGSDLLKALQGFPVRRNYISTDPFNSNTPVLPATILPTDVITPSKSIYAHGVINGKLYNFTLCFFIPLFRENGLPVIEFLIRVELDLNALGNIHYLNNIPSLYGLYGIDNIHGNKGAMIGSSFNLDLYNYHLVKGFNLAIQATSHNDSIVSVFDPYYNNVMNDQFNVHFYFPMMDQFMPLFQHLSPISDMPPQEILNSTMITPSPVVTGPVVPGMDFELDAAKSFITGTNRLILNRIGINLNNLLSQQFDITMAVQGEVLLGNIITSSTGAITSDTYIKGDLIGTFKHDVALNGAVNGKITTSGVTLIGVAYEWSLPQIQNYVTIQNMSVSLPFNINNANFHPDLTGIGFSIKAIINAFGPNFQPQVSFNGAITSSGWGIETIDSISVPSFETFVGLPQEAINFFNTIGLTQLSMQFSLATTNLNVGVISLEEGVSFSSTASVTLPSQFTAPVRFLNLQTLTPSAGIAFSLKTPTDFNAFISIKNVPPPSTTQLFTLNSIRLKIQPASASVSLKASATFMFTQLNEGPFIVTLSGSYQAPGIIMAAGTIQGTWTNVAGITGLNVGNIGAQISLTAGPIVTGLGMNGQISLGQGTVVDIAFLVDPVKNKYYIDGRATGISLGHLVSFIEECAQVTIISTALPGMIDSLTGIAIDNLQVLISPQTQTLVSGQVIPQGFQINGTIVFLQAQVTLVAVVQETYVPFFKRNINDFVLAFDVRNLNLENLIPLIGFADYLILGIRTELAKFSTTFTGALSLCVDPVCPPNLCTGGTIPSICVPQVCTPSVCQTICNPVCSFLGFTHICSKPQCTQICAPSVCLPKVPLCTPSVTLPQVCTPQICVPPVRECPFSGLNNIANGLINATESILTTIHNTLDSLLVLNNLQLTKWDLFQTVCVPPICQNPSIGPTLLLELTVVDIRVNVSVPIPVNLISQGVLALANIVKTAAISEFDKINVGLVYAVLKKNCHLLNQAACVSTPLGKVCLPFCPVV